MAGGRTEKKKTIGEMMEEMRRKAGAKEYVRHSYMEGSSALRRVRREWEVVIRAGGSGE